MAETTHSVLLVDDRPDEVKPLLDDLPDNIDLLTESRADRAVTRIEKRSDISVVLLDLIFDGQRVQGEQAFDMISDRFPDLPVIILSASTDIALALRLVQGRKGKKRAYNYFLKDHLDLDQLLKTVENAVAHHSLLWDRVRVTDRGLIVGRSPVLQRVLLLLGRVAETDIPVLITGESGTGKELFARAIHLNSKRRTRAFVVKNCGAIAENLVASELFGTAKGAFTGAVDRKGAFEQAHGGTLFLDEIGDLPLEQQANLLRALQFGEIQKLGGQTSQVDVRIIAATNRDLEAATRDRHFREDLLYRLKVFPVNVPPLRCRRGDIGLLANHILAKFKPGLILEAEALALLESHAWPGNVRELENVLQRLVILSSSDTINRSAVEEVLETRPAAAIPEDVEYISLWATRILSGAVTWSDLRQEFLISSGTMRLVFKQVIEQFTATQGRRPTGSDLAKLLDTNRNHVNQSLRQMGLRLRDYSANHIA